jgi:hypothetical protein
MKEEIVFFERQKMFLFAFLCLGVALFFIYETISQIVYGKTFGDNPSSDTGLIIGSAVLLFITALLFSVSLKTTVNKEGIYVKLFPFNIRYQYFPWESITKSYIRKYKPIMEYGGWGIKVGSIFQRRGPGFRCRLGLHSKRNDAFTVSGNMGLQLEFVSGRKLLIGTHKPEELAETLRKLGKLNE